MRGVKARSGNESLLEVKPENPSAQWERRAPPSKYGGGVGDGEEPRGGGQSQCWDRRDSALPGTEPQLTVVGQGIPERRWFSEKGFFMRRVYMCVVKRYPGRISIRTNENNLLSK